VSRRATTRTNLPVERGAFVGRERALLGIAKLLTEPARVVVLCGPPGIGKTRLALRAAARELPRVGVEGGVWLVECLGADDAMGLVRLVGLMLGLLPDPTAGVHAERARVAAVLAERGPCLVVVDGVDEVKDAVAVLHSLAALCPGARFLVTQRASVTSTSDVVAVSVGPLSLHRERRPGDVSEAAALFIERANEARGSHARRADAAELAAIDAIARHLEGVPQAIELAAARCRVLTPAELVERLPRHAPGTSGTRRSALAGVVAWSLDLLQPWERAALAQGVIFHGGFTLDAAREVIDLHEIAGAPSVDVVVQSLVDKALLKAMVPASDGPLRYNHPSAVRELIVQVRPHRRAAEPPRHSTLEVLPGAPSSESIEAPRIELFSTREALARRHATWVLGHCGTLRENVDGHGGLLARLELEAEHENVLAVVRRALADEPPSLAGLTQALLGLVVLEPVMTTRGPHDVFARLLDRTVDQAEPLGVAPALMARVSELRARVRRARGQLAASKEDLAAALTYARRARDRVLEARALANLGTHAIAVADLNAARTAYNEASAILREQRDARLEARCVGFYGLLEEELGNLDVAADHYTRAIEAHRRLGDRRYEAIHVSQLARVSLGRGRFDEADDHLRHALAVHRELHNRRHEAMTLVLQGDLELLRGERDDGLALWASAASTAREVGDPGLVALVHARLARANRARGQDARAHDIVIDAALQRVDDGGVHAAVAVLRGRASTSTSILPTAVHPTAAARVAGVLVVP
jgi:predicted ATPase